MTLLIDTVTDRAALNTLSDVEMQIQVVRERVKDIANSCKFCAQQTRDPQAQKVFTLLSQCKTRKQMLLVFGVI